MKEKPLRRSNRERTEITRIRLLDAARQLFLERGYAETSTPDVVRAAGVTRGALYHHFSDKKDLFRAVVEREASQVAETIDRDAPASLPADAALLTGAEVFLEAMREPGRVRLLLLDGPAVLGWEELTRLDVAHGRRTLREGLLHALPANDDDESTLDALADVLSAAFDRAALAIAEGAPPEPYRHALRALLRALLR